MLQLLLKILMATAELPFNVVFPLKDSTVAPPSADVRSLSRVRRVVGGSAGHIDRVPYLVNIRRRGVFECGGSLITPRCVLTAAHCIKDSPPTDFVVRGGVTYLNDYRNSRRVQNIFKPTKYDSKALDHDVAVFQLDQPLQGDNIAVIALATHALQPGEYIKISGWGLTSENALNPPNQMRTARLRVIPQHECRQLYASYRNVSEAMFCASIPGQTDACSADSGGPAVSYEQLVGVVSWGKGRECGRAESPGVYVRITEIKSWIEEIMRENCY